ncbi:MAG: DoxX family protein [Chitinophagales bacterium]|nr:DoxX family protein [Chitinophagales bacterium]
MAFLLGLLMMYVLMWLISLAGIGWLEESVMRGILATTIMFVMVGISHFAKPDKLLAMIPPNWPYREAMNYISGAAEILLAIGLLFGGTRVYAAYGLIALLICIFPANIYVAITKPGIYNISRLFFQPVYILWIYWFSIRS